MTEAYSVIDTETLGNRKGTTFQTPWGTLVIYLEDGEVHINLGQFDALYNLPSQVTVSASKDEVLNPNNELLNKADIDAIAHTINELLERIYRNLKSKACDYESLKRQIVATLKAEMNFFEIKENLPQTGVLKLREG